MDFLQFQDVRFAYPPVEGDTDENGNPVKPPVLFDHFTATLPGGFISLVGPNASGKSTFMLLAAGRLLPLHGTVFLEGHDTASLSPEARDRLASFIYQNMEFESDDTVSVLLNQVYAAGSFAGNAQPVPGNFPCGAGGSLGADGVPGKNSGTAGQTGIAAADSGSPALLDQVVAVLELEPLLHHRLSGLSKGELQRVIIAFSLLYGSRSVFMDEPLFALETPRKHRVLAYIKQWCAAFGTTVYISMHELELNRMYPDNILLFYPNRDMDFGTPEEVLTRDALEKAYGVPAALLKDAEALTRKSLMEQYGVESRDGDK